MANSNPVIRKNKKSPSRSRKESGTGNSLQVSPQLHPDKLITRIPSYIGYSGIYRVAKYPKKFVDGTK